VEHHQNQAKAQQINYGERVCQKFGHASKIKNRRAMAVFKIVNSEGLLTKLIIRRHQVVGNHLGRAAFDVVAFDHVHQFPILEQAHAGRGRRERDHQASGSVYGFPVYACENGYQAVGCFVVAEAHFRCRARIGCGTAAYRIYDHQYGARLVYGVLNRFGRKELFESD
jgi:hypothetical protein